MGGEGSLLAESKSHASRFSLLSMGLVVFCRIFNKMPSHGRNGHPSFLPLYLSVPCRFLLLLFLGLPLIGCSPYAKVKEMRPRYAAMATGTGDLATAARNLQAALATKPKLSPQERMGRC